MHPGPGRHVGNGIIACEERNPAQALVHHAVESQGFIAVTVDGVRNPARRVTQEMTALTEHRAHATDLKHQPLQHDVLRPHFARHELPGLFRQILQDRTGFENRKRLAAGAIAIDDGGDLVIRVDLEKARLELLATQNIDGLEPIAKARLFQHDRHLVAIGCGPIIKIDHLWDDSIGPIGRQTC